MSKDIQDILAVPADICVLIEDRFDVLRGLVGCSGDLESGCLEPFESNEYYKACVLDVSTTYYTTRIQVRSFDKLDIYLEWQNQSNHQHPSALFLCVDMNKSENDLKDFLDKAKTLDLDEIDTHSLLLFGQLPCVANNVDHPKTKLIQNVVDNKYIEVVRFDPNEQEMEDLEDGSEKHGIERTWELVGVAEWKSKIMKPGAGRFVSSLSVQPTSGVASSLSTKCNPKRLAVMENLTKKSQEEPTVDRAFSDMEPSAEDERYIYEFLSNAKSNIIEPECRIEKVPALSMKYLMEQRQRAQNGMRMSQANNLHGCSMHYLTEATFLDYPQNQNARMCIVDTTKRFEPDKETREINVTTSVQQPRPTLEEKASIVQQKKGKKAKNKKQTDTSLDINVEQKQQEGIQGIENELEQIFEQISLNEESNTTTDESSNKQVKNDDKETSSLSQHLENKKIEKEESKKDQ